MAYAQMPLSHKLHINELKSKFCFTTISG